MRLSCFELREWLADHSDYGPTLAGEAPIRSDRRYVQEGIHYDTRDMEPVSCAFVLDSGPNLNVQETVYRLPDGSWFIEQRMPFFESYGQYLTNIIANISIVEHYSVLLVMFALYPFVSGPILGLTGTVNLINIAFYSAAIAWIAEALFFLGAFPFARAVERMITDNQAIEGGDATNVTVGTMQTVRTITGWNPDELRPVARRERVIWDIDNLMHWWSSPYYPERIYRAEDGRYLYERCFPHGRSEFTIKTPNGLRRQLTEDDREGLLRQLDSEDQAFEPPNRLP